MWQFWKQPPSHPLRAAKASCSTRLERTKTTQLKPGQDIQTAACRRGAQLTGDMQGAWCPGILPTSKHQETATLEQQAL